MGNTGPMRPLKEGNLLATFAFADQFLFLFDYDGTLSNIVSDPSQAIIAETELHQMHKLASEPKHTVWVISGRDRTFLQTQLGNLTNIGLAAEHGAFMRRPGSQDWKNMALEADLHWRPHVKKVFDAFVLQTPGARLEQKETALVLHYREAEQHDVVTAQALRCKHDLEGQVGTSGVKIIRGKCSIEARPAIVDKGLTVKTILEQFQRLNGKLPNFTLCVGDDVTDEDMFRALHASRLSGVFTVKIGHTTEESNAEFCLKDPIDVHTVIAILNERKNSPAPFFKLIE